MSLHRGEAEPDERRVLGAIVAVVDLAGLEARLEVHVAVIRDDVGAGAAGEAPAPPGDDHGRRPAVLADRQLGVRIVEAGDRMRNVVPIRERKHVDGAVRPELAAHETRDRLRAVGGRGDGERHHAVPARHVGLPAHPRHGIAVPHEKSIAEVLGRARIGHAHRAVEEAERDLPPAVRQVEEEPAIPGGRVDGAEEIEVRPALHLAAGVRRRERDVGDGRVHGEAGVDGEADDPRERFVGAGAPEGAAIEHRRAGVNLERGHGHDGLLSAGSRCLLRPAAAESSTGAP